jgi:hypothetical protein
MDFVSWVLLRLDSLLPNTTTAKTADDSPPTIDVMRRPHINLEAEVHASNSRKRQRTSSPRTAA